MATKHSYFKRKSLKSIETPAALVKSNSSTTKGNTTSASASSSSNCYSLASAGGGGGGGDDDDDDVDGKIELRTRTISTGSTGGCGGGVGGNLAKASKLKLKMSFTKTNSKLKWTQKFHWLQNYVRSADARADLRKSFAQSTSSQRLNSNSSNSKHYNTFNKIQETTINKASTTTTTTLVDCENLGASVGSLLQENCFLVNPEISIVNDENDGDHDDNDDDDDDNDNNNNNNSNANTQMQEFSTNVEHDYYSSICDNQLSFNNSPCKSPRSLGENMKIINHHSRQQDEEQQQPPLPLVPPPSLTLETQYENNSDQQQQQQRDLQQKQKHLNPSVTISNNDATSRVVVVAARPANKQAIGFNIKTNPMGTTAVITTTTTNDSGSNSSGYATATTTNSGSSIYGTPPTSKGAYDNNIVDMEKQSPFVFPNISAEITELAQVLKTTTTSSSSSNEHNLGNGSIKTHQHQQEQKQQQQQHEIDKH